MKFFRNFLLLLLITSSKNNFATTRQMPFFNRINVGEAKKNSINFEAFGTLSTPEYKREDATPNNYKDFSGAPLSLKKLQTATNDYNTSLGKPSKVYLSSTDKVVSRYLNHDDLEVYIDTNSQGINLSYVGKIKFPFMNYINDSKHMKKFSGLLENTSFIGGFSLPVMHVSRGALYQPKSSVRRLYETEESEILASGQIDTIMQRMTGPDLKLATWSNTGLGNLTLFAGQCFDKESFHKIKNFDAGYLFMLELPTAKKRDEDNVLSFSFGMPTVSLGLNLFANLHLRYGLSVGADFQAIFPWNYTSDRRISLANEPNEFSPYVSSFKTNLGIQTALAPYVQWTFYRDITFDFKLSFVTIGQGKEKVSFNGPGKGLNEIARINHENKEDNPNGSSWNAKYWNLCIKTGTNLKIAPWISRPELRVSYDFPWHRNESAPNHRFGISLKFDI